MITVVWFFGRILFPIGGRGGSSTLLRRGLFRCAVPCCGITRVGLVKNSGVSSCGIARTERRVNSGVPTCGIARGRRVKIGVSYCGRARFGWICSEGSSGGMMRRTLFSSEVSPRVGTVNDGRLDSRQVRSAMTSCEMASGSLARSRASYCGMTRAGLISSEVSFS